MASGQDPNPIRDLWERTHQRAGGRRLFSLLLGRLVPYTGTVRPRVEELGHGHARVSMRDRRRIRNHLRSVHAIAIMNLAEVTGGLALNFSLPPDARAILTRLSIDYLKKARGTLTADARFDPPLSSERQEFEFDTVVRDDSGDEVARARARWLIGPREPT